MPTEARITEHRQQLDQLLPPGLLWTRRPGSNREKLLTAIAAESARFEELTLALIDEADPRTTSDLLDEWEAYVGLPDPCVPTSITFTDDERRAQIVARLNANGGQSRQFFIDLAAAIGFTITITEFTTFQVGISGAGDPVGGETWVYAWQVNTATDARSPILECLFHRLAPAHTVVIFNYT